jgi:AraC family transcriptional regulator
MALGRSKTAVFAVRQWPGMRSEYGWVPPTGRVTVSRPQQVGVSFAVHERVVAERDGHTHTFAIRPGDVFATGHEQVFWSQVTAVDEWVEIYPDPSLLRAVAGTSTTPEIGTAVATRDVVTLAVASILKRAHVHDEPLDDVHASTLAHRLAEHVVRRHCGIAGDRRHHAPGQLDRRTLDRVAELVEARLADPLTVDDLAAAATLSPSHFARAFRASTGLTPHQFVMSRRMERAKILLLHSRLPVPHIAHAVGYSNVSHFRRTFKRCTGFKPADLRSS